MSELRTPDELTVTSEWRGQELWWCINGEWLSESALRSWCFHNIEANHQKYITDCVRHYHVKAYAEGNRHV